jgi:propionyl-CoA carboxylase beta chain
MGPEGAVNIIFRKEIQAAPDHEAKRKDLVLHYRRRFANPFYAAELGYVDDIIYPRQTRFRLIQALSYLENKRDLNPPKKHGNIPL